MAPPVKPVGSAAAQKVDMPPALVFNDQSIFGEFYSSFKSNTATYFPINRCILYLQKYVAGETNYEELIKRLDAWNSSGIQNEPISQRAKAGLIKTLQAVKDPDLKLRAQQALMALQSHTKNITASAPTAASKVEPKPQMAPATSPPIAIKDSKPPVVAAPPKTVMTVDYKKFAKAQEEVKTKLSDAAIGWTPEKRQKYLMVSYAIIKVRDFVAGRELDETVVRSAVLRWRQDPSWDKDPVLAATYQNLLKALNSIQEDGNKQRAGLAYVAMSDVNAKVSSFSKGAPAPISAPDKPVKSDPVTIAEHHVTPDSTPPTSATITKATKDIFANQRVEIAKREHAKMMAKTGKSFHFNAEVAIIVNLASGEVTKVSFKNVKAERAGTKGDNASAAEVTELMKNIANAYRAEIKFDKPKKKESNFNLELKADPKGDKVKPEPMGPPPPPPSRPVAPSAEKVAQAPTAASLLTDQAIFKDTLSTYQSEKSGRCFPLHNAVVYLRKFLDGEKSVDYTTLKQKLKAWESSDCYGDAVSYAARTNLIALLGAVQEGPMKEKAAQALMAVKTLKDIAPPAAPKPEPKPESKPVAASPVTFGEFDVIPDAKTPSDRKVTEEDFKASRVSLAVREHSNTMGKSKKSFLFTGEVYVVHNPKTGEITKVTFRNVKAERVGDKGDQPSQAEITEMMKAIANSYRHEVKFALGAKQTIAFRLTLKPGDVAPAAPIPQSLPPLPNLPGPSPVVPKVPAKEEALKSTYTFSFNGENAPSGSPLSPQGIQAAFVAASRIAVNSFGKRWGSGFKITSKVDIQLDAKGYVQKVVFNDVKVGSGNLNADQVKEFLEFVAKSYRGRIIAGPGDAIKFDKPVSYQVVD